MTPVRQFLVPGLLTLMFALLAWVQPLPGLPWVCLLVTVLAVLWLGAWHGWLLQRALDRLEDWNSAARADEDGTGRSL